MYHPMYIAQMVDMPTAYTQALSGDTFSEHFCMVNFPTCRIELKAFYLLTEDRRLLKEDLFNFDDFTVSVPLWW